MNDVPPDLGRLLDALPAPALPPVDVAAILGRDAERAAASVRFWKRVAGSAIGLAAAALLALGWLGTRPESVPDEWHHVQARLVKLESDEPPDLAKFEAKLTDINDLLLTLAADVNERDEKQRLALRTLAKQMSELRSLSDNRWTEAKTTTDALYILQQSNRKE